MDKIRNQSRDKVPYNSSAIEATDTQKNKEAVLRKSSSRPTSNSIHHYSLSTKVLLFSIAGYLVLSTNGPVESLQNGKLNLCHINTITKLYNVCGLTYQISY